jgi:alanine-glyoxylate transaminase/serine-glyoxylate transaminase/serine-pyruvate transaminase
MAARFARHRHISRACKAAISGLGLTQVPVRAEIAADTMTAPYFPEGIDRNVLAQIKAAGAILAGGLHPAIKTQYFRIGHMGVVSPSDILATIGAVEAGLAQAGYNFSPGSGLAAAQKALLS